MRIDIRPQDTLHFALWLRTNRSYWYFTIHVQPDLKSSIDIKCSSIAQIKNIEQMVIDYNKKFNTAYKVEIYGADGGSIYASIFDSKSGLVNEIVLQRFPIDG